MSPFEDEPLMNQAMITFLDYILKVGIDEAVLQVKDAPKDLLKYFPYLQKAIEDLESKEQHQ